MGILRKSLKAYIIAAAMFFVMSLILAAIVCFTGFKESWSLGGLIFILSLSCGFFGFFEGRIVGKRGIVVGILAAFVFMGTVLFILKLTLTKEFYISSLGFVHFFSAAAGAVGGIIGVSGERN